MTKTDSFEDLPVAYCAPGAKNVAALTLALIGQPVIEIREHPWLDSESGYVLVCDMDETFLAPPYEITFNDQACPRCGWWPPTHSVTCAFFPWPAYLPPSGPLITGVPEC